MYVVQNVLEVQVGKARARARGVYVRLKRSDSDVGQNYRPVWFNILVPGWMDVSISNPCISGWDIVCPILEGAVKEV